jgi:hypothetical protein
MRRLLRICLAILCLSIAAHNAAAQDRLPFSFAGWSSVDISAVAPSFGNTQIPQAPSPNGLDGFLGPDAPFFHEYFVKSVERRAYMQANQPALISLYHFRDPSSAYGAFTFLRDDSLSSADLGSYAGVSDTRALIVVGEMLLDISAPVGQKRPSDADLKQLADLLDKKADHTPYPFIGEHLPEKGRVKNSERYVIGPRSLAHFVPLGTDDWMGYDHSAETILARYSVAGNDETLLITSYPTQQVAAAEFAGILRRFVFDPPGGVQPGQTVLFGKRVSSYIAIVTGAPSKQAANKVLDQVGYASNVTWDEPKQSYTEPGISSMIVEAFLGTGAIMVFAVAAGIGFGGLRILVKIFLPNKVFDREKQIEILQLGISSKPIKAKDFY